MTTFLSNRLQRVFIDNVSSPYALVTIVACRRAVSVLGPLLFLLFINDVADVFDGTVNVKLYADDINIYILKL